MSIDLILLQIQTRAIKAFSKQLDDDNLLEELSRDRILAEEAIREYINDENSYKHSKSEIPAEL